jgi:HSP20 family protein
MSDTTSELKVKEKKEVPGKAEYTRPGRIFSPSVDIFESEAELTVLADLPGVTQEKLDIDLHEDVLTITADITEETDPGESSLLKEF